jgi:hypothetical protein
MKTEERSHSQAKGIVSGLNRPKEVKLVGQLQDLCSGQQKKQNARTTNYKYAASSARKSLFHSFLHCSFHINPSPISASTATKCLDTLPLMLAQKDQATLDQQHCKWSKMKEWKAS